MLTLEKVTSDMSTLKKSLQIIPTYNCIKTNTGCCWGGDTQCKKQVKPPEKGEN